MRLSSVRLGERSFHPSCLPSCKVGTFYSRTDRLNELGVSSSNCSVNMAAGIIITLLQPAARLALSHGIHKALVLLRSLLARLLGREML